MLQKIYRRARLRKILINLQILLWLLKIEEEEGLTIRFLTEKQLTFQHLLELIDDIPFKTGGRVGFRYGSIAKKALDILNKNKKNAEYMFKASDNVSPGYTKGDMKYNAELLAEQLAEDAGVVYDDLADLDRIKFYGTAYDYLAQEMGMYRAIEQNN